MTSPTFEIVSLRPTSHADVWTAEFTYREPETISGVEAGHVADLRVRFGYDESGSVTGLLDAAYAKAREFVGHVQQGFTDKGISAHRAEAAALIEEQSKPFEINFSELPKSA